MDSHENSTKLFLMGVYIFFFFFFGIYLILGVPDGLVVKNLSAKQMWV